MAHEPEFPAKTIAALLDISLARVGQLAKEGVIVRLPNGKYPADAIPQYIRFLRAQSKRTDYTELIDKEKYRQMKRQNDIEEGEVAPVALLTEALEKAAVQIVPVLDTLPLMMKRHWPEITGDQIMMVKKTVAECRNIIASMELKH